MSAELGRAIPDELAQCPCGHVMAEHDELGNCRHSNRSTRTGYCKCSEWVGTLLLNGRVGALIDGRDDG